MRHARGRAGDCECWLNRQLGHPQAGLVAQVAGTAADATRRPVIAVTTVTDADAIISIASSGLNRPSKSARCLRPRTGMSRLAQRGDVQRLPEPPDAPAR